MNWWTHMAITKMDNRMRQLPNKDVNTWNVIMVKIKTVKYQWYINRNIEERADYGNVNVATILETLDMQPEDLSESRFRDIIRKNGCKDEDKSS